MFDFTDNDNSFLPMAERMRPTSIEEVFGQKHILSENKTLRKMIDKDKITSMVFFGPPGVGKSTVASIIAKKTKRGYKKSGKKFNQFKKDDSIYRRNSQI